MNVNFTDLMNLVYDILKLFYYSFVFWAIKNFCKWLYSLINICPLFSSPRWALPSISFFKINKKSVETYPSISQTCSSQAASQTQDAKTCKNLQEPPTKKKYIIKNMIIKL
jgi:hypothetical protein